MYIEPIPLIPVIDTHNLISYSDISRRRKAAYTHLDVRRPRSLDIQKSNSGPVAAHTGTAMKFWYHLIPTVIITDLMKCIKSAKSANYSERLFLERSMPTAW